MRDGEPLTVLVPPAAWPLTIEARPAFEPDVLTLYERGRGQMDGQHLADGVVLWREAAARVDDRDRINACWLYGRIGRAWAEADKQPEAVAAFGEAVACAEVLEPLVVAVLRMDEGRAARERGWLDVAEEAFGEVVNKGRDALTPLALADALAELGRTQYLRGHIDEGLESYLRAREIEEVDAPDSLPLARTLVGLAYCRFAKSEIDEAEALCARAEAMSGRIGPTHSVHLDALEAWGGILTVRGDWVGAERLWTRGFELAPEDSLQKWSFLGSLGALASIRGDRVTAEALTRRALSHAESIGDRANRALLLGNLAVLALDGGDADRAEEFLRQALAERGSAAVDRMVVITQLHTMGRARRMKGDLDGARVYLEEALAESEKTYGGLTVLVSLVHLADLARARGDGQGAEALYRRALPLLSRPEPFGPRQAQVLHGMGVVARAQGRMDEAADHFKRALAALEFMRGRHGGSDEARAFFDSRYFGIYHDQAELLVRQGCAAEAFEVLELSRARSLLALLSERDLLVEDGIPPDLEQERRRTDAEYQRAYQGAQRADPADRSRSEAALQRMVELRDQQNRIAAQIRELSPRLADVRYPEPLPLAQIQAALEPGTVLLAYSVGEEATVLFAITRDDVEAAAVPAGEAELARRIGEWRREIEKGVPRPAFYQEARALYDVLLRPAEVPLQKATRLLVSPSGPLHGLPFAALMRDDRYLVEWKPITIVPSGTMQAQWVRSRRKPGSCSLVAFADPLHPAADKPLLPESRREVEAIAVACPERTLHVGDEATEEQAKRLPKDARYVHFACHAIVDERLPLDSALVLDATAPQEGRASGEDGLLQAWEIYERVRVDADLVTLSACDSGSGKALAGEGLLGLTRAFQYAGARTVLASLWSVSDRSTVDLMRDFYAGLGRGLPKDDALRQAQVAAIGTKAVRSRPLRWAGFELFGDWK
jgi:CHAT domain-containing protein